MREFSTDATCVTNSDFTRFIDNTGYQTDADAFGFSAVRHLALQTDASDVLGSPPDTSGWLCVRTWPITAPVRSYEPNGYGLWQIGTVWEWCADGRDADYYARSSRCEPGGPHDGDVKVLHDAYLCHDSY